MHTIRTALLDLAAAEPSIRPIIVPMARQAEKWKSMPKGWTDESRKKFWDSLTGGAPKHKVTKCIKEMEGKGGIDDPGAFCASLADRVLGPEWRKKKAFDAPYDGGIPSAQGKDWVFSEKGGIKTWRWSDKKYGLAFAVVETDDERNFLNAGYSYLLKAQGPDRKVHRFKRLLRHLNNAFYQANQTTRQFRKGDNWLNGYSPLGGTRLAAHEQTPNQVDGAAARFKDHLELKINEHYRMAHPADVPPTLTLIHGNDLIRVIKADGSLHREAVAFIARSTGNVYRAATWDRPHPHVIANVLESSSWRSMRMAFDQFNVPELLGQLKKVLIQKGLDDTWAEIQRCKVPQKVNDAWMGLSKKDRRRRAELRAASGWGGGQDKPLRSTKVRRGKTVRVGDTVSFKSDVEQQAEVIEITEKPGPMPPMTSGVWLTLKAPPDGFEGDYIRNRRTTTIRADTASLAPALRRADRLAELRAQRQNR